MIIIHQSVIIGDTMAQRTSNVIYDLLPLFYIVAGIAIATYVKGLMTSSYWMHDFMGFFFLVFGGLKAYNLVGFARTFRTYDVLAATIPGYAYIYPFIELGLAICYLIPYGLLYANIVTLAIMSIGAIGVFQALWRGTAMECACLGMVFVVPMTYVTLFEDLLMALMAAYMLYV